MHPVRALGAALILAGSLLAVTSALGVTSAAGAAPGPPPPYVTDYANYPGNAGVPAGCDSSGVTGVSFTLNGGTSSPTLQGLPAVQAGDTVAMTWTGVADVCVGAPIVLVMKDAPSPFFDATALQPAVSPFEGQTLTAGGGSMTFVLPDLAAGPDSACNYQLDAILGAPLLVVGPLPNGNFYGSDLRGSGPNLLISAKNGGYETCTAPPSSTTSTTSPPSTTTTLPATFQFAGATTVCIVEVPTIVITFQNQFPTLAGRTGTLTMSDTNGSLVSTQPLVYEPNTTVNLLYPGTRVNADGTIADVPGWNLNEFGFWVRDPSDALLRDGINLTYTVNPTATAFVTYPPESSGCANPNGPFPPGETPPPGASNPQGASNTAAQRTLAATGTGTAPWTALAGMVAVVFGVLLLLARRHITPRRSS